MPAVPDQFREALALHQQGRLDEAAALYRAILQTEPLHAGALHHLGIIAYVTDRCDQAYRLISQSLDVRPDAAAFINRANVLWKLKKHDEALADYDRAFTLDPNRADAFSNRAVVLTDLNRPGEALVALDRAIALDPRSAVAHYNRGNALLALERRENAIAAYDVALTLNPKHPEAHFNRAKALAELGHAQDAAAGCRAATVLSPGYAEAHWMEALCLLAAGDFAPGWEKYEWRWRMAPQMATRRNFPQPLWSGAENVAGRTMLLHAEQGFGDTLQFCRYAPLLTARGARVILEVQPELVSLLVSMSGGAQVIAHGAPLPDFDLHCPLMSLPRAFKTTFATIPAVRTYVQAQPDLVGRWRGRLDQAAGGKTGPRVGLVWSGRAQHPNDRHRSIDPDLLTPLLQNSATFVSLQKHLRPQDQQWLKDHPEVLHFGGDLEDFADTAALASVMDLVITVDTSAAHLAGALGRPVWILLPFIAPDWRWLLDRTDSPWYPTARLFRQPAMGAWGNVIARVEEALDSF